MSSPAVRTVSLYRLRFDPNEIGGRFVEELLQLAQADCAGDSFTGLELDQMSDEGISDKTERISLFRVGLPKNRWLFGGIGLAVLIQLSVVCVPPLQPVFCTVPLSAGDWVLVLLIASSTPANERLRKAVAPRHLEQRRIVELQECTQGR